MGTYRTCLTVALIFGSQYLLIPVLHDGLSEQMDTPLFSTAYTYLLVTVGMLLVGSFQGYLVDTLSRKHIGAFAILMLAGITLAYSAANRIPELFIFPLLQGVALGLAYLSLTTIMIDNVTSQRRDYMNRRFGAAMHIGMVLGLASGMWVHTVWGFDRLLLVSTVLELMALVVLLTIPVAFRAPIGIALVSLDRFLLPRALPLCIQATLLGSILGLIFGSELPLFPWKMAALAIPCIATAVIHRMTVGMAQHCQRGTANASYLLFWQLGIGIGTYGACYLRMRLLDGQTLLWAGILIGLAVLYYFVVSSPYYKRLHHD